MGAKSSGLKELSEDMQKAVKAAVPEVRKVVSKGSMNIKKEAKRIIRDVSGRGYLPHYPKSITYDLKTAGTLVSSEIGPDSGRLQGGLGRLLEDGSVNNPPYPHLSPALDLEEHAFCTHLEEVGEALLAGKFTPAPEPAADADD